MTDKPSTSAESAAGNPSQPKGAQPKGPKGLDTANGPTRYLDRPTNDGKHGDEADEPNEGNPRSQDEFANQPRKR